jgi:hypothetical protein
VDSLSIDDLREARLENVERLASALGVKPPFKTANKVVYKQRLVGAVLSQLRRDAQRAELERLNRL